MNNTIKLENNVEQVFVDPLTELLRKGAKDLITSAVETELSVFLEEFKNVKLLDGRAGVVRNGYQPEREILSSVGPVKVKIPKVRSRTGEPVTFHSVLVPPYIRKARSVEASLPWLYLMGISTGKMGEALKLLVGENVAGLSPAVVSRLKKEWEQQYKLWCSRDLSDKEYSYIWVDGIHSNLRTPTDERIDGKPDKLCCLVVIGVTVDGDKEFLAITDGERESKLSWKDVLRDLKERGLNTPKLAVGDGALGFWAAAEEMIPQMKHQRCWIHKSNNVVNYLPKKLEDQARRELKEIYSSDTRDDANKEIDKFISKYEPKWPKAAECLNKDRDELLSFYDFPAQHWKSLRTTNVIESTFATIRHRQKQTKNNLSRSSCLAMIFKLAVTAENNFNRLEGYRHLTSVMKGDKYINGEPETMINQTAA